MQRGKDQELARGEEQVQRDWQQGALLPQRIFAVLGRQIEPDLDWPEFPKLNKTILLLFGGHRAILDRAGRCV